MTSQKTQPSDSSCRLCGGETSLKFSQTLLGKHSVGYWHCLGCGSLQTERPHWLDEAYADTVPLHDTGMVSRTLQMTQITSRVLALAGVGPRSVGLDFGGGNGLFCRMMRDQGFNFLNYDKYATPYYSVGFNATALDADKFDILTSFEVFEHLPEPKSDLAEIVTLSPRLWFFSTQIYKDENGDWSYLALRTGRHVFFYNEKALRDFAESHGYDFLRGRLVHLFVRRHDNPFLQQTATRTSVRRLLQGKRFSTFMSLLAFERRQRNAYLRWKADSDAERPISL